MGDRIRMRQLCREAVDCSGDSNGVDSVDRNSSRSGTFAVKQVQEERRLLFCPYNHGRTASAGRAGQKKESSR